MFVKLRVVSTLVVGSYGLSPKQTKQKMTIPEGAPEELVRLFKASKLPKGVIIDTAPQTEEEIEKWGPGSAAYKQVEKDFSKLLTVKQMPDMGGGDPSAVDGAPTLDTTEEEKGPSVEDRNKALADAQGSEEGLSPAVEACKSRLPDKTAYANCLMHAVAGGIAGADLRNLKVEDKEVFCSDVIPMFKMLEEQLNTRFANPTLDGDEVQKAMQDVLFIQNALNAYKKFCGTV